MRGRALVAISALVLGVMSAGGCSDQSAPARHSSSTQPTPSATGPAWPMLGANIQRTGVSLRSGPDDPAELWAVELDHYDSSSPAVGVDGTVYVGAESRLVAVAANGTTEWAFPAGGAVWSSPAIASDGTIYVGMFRGDTAGHRRGRVYAVRPNGTQKWEFDPGDWVQSSPAIAADGTVYFCCSDGSLHALRPDGKEKWVYEAGGALWGSPPAVGPDGTVYFVSSFFPNGRLFAVTRAGTLRWTFAGGFGMDDTPVVGPDGTIYVLDDYGQTLHALDPEGEERWTSDFKRPPVDASSPQPKPPGHVALAPAISADGMVCVACTDGRVYGLTADGVQKWQVNVGGAICDSPTIGADGTIYIAGDGLHALGPDGAERWEMLSGRRSNTSPVIGAGGTIFCVLDSGTLAAIGERR